MRNIMQSFKKNRIYIKSKRILIRSIAGKEERKNEKEEELFNFTTYVFNVFDEWMYTKRRM